MDYSQEKMQQSGMLNSQLGAQVAENPLMSLMRDYVRAKEQFDQACHAAQQCAEHKAMSEKQLLALSEKVSQVVQQGIYDPTMPPVPQPAMPTNGLTGGMQGFGQTRF